MVQHVLLLEPKTAIADELVEKIEQHAGLKVHAVKTMREACACLAEQRVELALLPVSRNDSLVYSLRMLQPDLKMVLLADETEHPVPERQAQVVWGILTKQDLLTALPTFSNLDVGFDALETLFWEKRNARTEALLARQSQATEEKLAQVAQKILAEPPVKFVMFLRGQEIVGYHRAGNQEEIVHAAQEVRSLWSGDSGAHHTQIQYLDAAHPPADPADAAGGWVHDTLVLYTRPLGELLITVGAAAATRVSDLRRLVERVSHQLLTPSLNQLNALISRPTPALPDPRRSYVLVWRPHQPLTPEARFILRQALPQISHSSGITLFDLILNERFVHVVATCPPQKGSAWLAQTLKDQSAERLKQQAGLPDPIWEPGYYTKEGGAPLSAAELNRFLLLQPE